MAVGNTSGPRFSEKNCSTTYMCSSHNFFPLIFFLSLIAPNLALTRVLLAPGTCASFTFSQTHIISFHTQSLFAQGHSMARSLGGSEAPPPPVPCPPLPPSGPSTSSTGQDPLQAPLLAQSWRCSDKPEHTKREF